MPKTIIKVKNLTKIYRLGSVETLALNDVSFKINKGEFVAIMGPSGSGKSTLMHILGALDRPTSGTYTLNGKHVGNLSDDQLADIRNRQIGFIFQSFNLLPRTTALKNVITPMFYGDIAKDKREAKAKKLLKLVDLEDRMLNNCNQLSGGEQQRVAIARALSMDPTILLADEPTGNVSTKQSDEIMTIFKHLNDKGHTVLMITHDPETAAFAKRIINLRDGKIIADHINKKRR